MDLKELSEVAAKNANFSPSENSHQHSDKPQLMTNDSTAWDYEDILQKIGKHLAEFNHLRKKNYYTS